MATTSSSKPFARKGRKALATASDVTGAEGHAPSGSTDLIQFRKANESIGLRISEGRLSLLSRKLYNVMVHHAQRLKTPGQNAPIHTEAAKSYFWIPLAEVARDAAFDSNDTALLKQHLEEFANMKIHLEDECQWTSERLVSSVKLVNPLGLKRRGSPVWLGYAFPPEVFQMVMQPSSYTKLSFYYQGQMRTGAALALYEICRRYATNPSKLTAINTTEWWQGALNGTPVREISTEYKYFKRDTLKPAIAEVNAITDIEITLIEHKQGRKVDRLQFRVELARQPSLEFPSEPVINSELIAKVVATGVSEAEAANLTAVYPEDRIEAALAALKNRVAQGGSQVHSTAAYFKWLVKNGPDAAPVTPALNAPKPRPAKEGPSLMERFLTSRANEAFNIIKEMDEADRQALIAQFRQDAAGRNVKLTAKGIDGPMARATMGRWYAQLLWGDPSAEDLSAYADAASSHAGGQGAAGRSLVLDAE